MFGKLLEATIKTCMLPLDIIKDVITIGGAMTDQSKSYTRQKLESIEEDVDEIGD